ncbi:MAG: tail assembly protein [Betaproteobacteria bacterium]|nr:tail assembly protein [Betaproteobacteria bacterium]
MHLTKIILDGPLGKKFGRKWELAVNSPREALNLIEANTPGLFNWLRQNAKKYSKYAITCKRGDHVEEFNEEQYLKQEGQFDEIRFVPVVEGAGAVARIVVGVILIVVGAVMTYFGNPYGVNVMMAGAAMAFGGVAELLAPKPKTSKSKDAEHKGSYYFNGPANTTEQGVPVQLIYGRCLVGSHAISAGVSIDQLM